VPIKVCPFVEVAEAILFFWGDVISEMNKTEVELTAYCGLYCGDCLRYKSKALELARDLMSELQAVRFDEYAKIKSASVKEFERYEECCQLLNAIVNLVCNTPCRFGGGGCLKPCEIKSCVQKKKIDGCWECDELDGCEKFEFLKPFSGEVPEENVRKIKGYGLNRWVRYRGKFYSWL